MSEEPQGTPLRDLRTGRLRTRVYRAGDRYLWRRDILRDAPPHGRVPVLPSHPGLAAAVKRTRETYDYVVQGEFSLGHSIWPPAVHTGSASPHARAMRCVGGALRALHAQGPVLASPAPRPQPVTRLSRWLDHADDHARHRLAAVLGFARVRELSAWCEALTGTASGPHTLLHGEPSVGVIVPLPDGTSTVLLTGETLAHGPAAFDTGWLLGELSEMARMSDPGHRPLFTDLTTAFLTGLGGLGPRPDLVALAAGLRSAVHVADYVTYVGWHDGLHDLIAILPDLVDTAGRTALDALGVPPA